MGWRNRRGNGDPPSPDFSEASLWIAAGDAPNSHNLLHRCQLLVAIFHVAQMRHNCLMPGLWDTPSQWSNPCLAKERRHNPCKSPKRSRFVECTMETALLSMRMTRPCHTQPSGHRDQNKTFGITAPRETQQDPVTAWRRLKKSMEESKRISSPWKTCHLESEFFGVVASLPWLCC